MNSPVDSKYRQPKRNAIIAMIGASLALGIADASFGPGNPYEGVRLGFTLLGNVILLVIGFRWLALDALELDIRRPTWLSVGIILVALVFVPYYLFKTRPQNRRMPAIFGFIGLIVGCALGSALGAALLLILNGDSAALPG